MPRLDVETDEQRRARLGTLFSSLSSPTAGDDAGAAAPAFPSSKPFAMPESDALARVRAFLPLMAQANADLAARAATEGADSVVIDGQLLRDASSGEAETQGESTAPASGEDGAEEGEESDGVPRDEEDRPEIEMDVGVGVFDVQGEVGGADVGPVVERDAAVWEGKQGEGEGEGKGGEGKGAQA